MSRSAVAYVLFVMMPLLTGFIWHGIARSRRWRLIGTSATTSSVFVLLLVAYPASRMTAGFAASLAGIAALLGLAASVLLDAAARKIGKRNLSCPYCGHVAMGPFRKSFLGAAWSVRCKSCGNRVSVSWRVVFDMIPVVIGCAIAALFESDAIQLVFVSAGLIGAYVFHVYVVPLTPREPGIVPQRIAPQRSG